MRKKPNAIKKLFNLDSDAIQIITDGANLNNMNKTEFIEFLAFNWAENNDPKVRLKKLENEISLRRQTEYLLRKEIEKTKKEVEMITNWRVTKIGEKYQIIKNLVRILSEKRWQDAEKISQLQGKRLGIPAIQLLTEALDKTKGEVE